MEKYKLKAWLGETIPLEVEWDTDIAGTATLYIYNDDEIVYEHETTFDDNVAILDISAEDCLSIGAGGYTWLIKVTYDSGEVDIVPQECDCGFDDDCEKPILEICEVIQ